jgi:hypothetical protein
MLYRRRHVATVLTTSRRFYKNSSSEIADFNETRIVRSAAMMQAYSLVFFFASEVLD